MLKGIGIDATEIERFRVWHTYSSSRLRKIFSQDEITYCLSTPKKSAERFAVRFATKEAFLKALVSAGRRISLLRVCKAVSITINDESPSMSVDWKLLDVNAMNVHFSLSHTKSSAVAVVVLAE